MPKTKRSWPKVNKYDKDKLLEKLLFLGMQKSYKNWLLMPTGDEDVGVLGLNKKEAKKNAEIKFNEAAASILPTLNEYKSKANTSATGLMTFVINKASGEKVKQGDNVAS